MASEWRGLSDLLHLNRKFIRANKNCLLMMFAIHIHIHIYPLLEQEYEQRI